MENESKEKKEAIRIFKLFYCMENNSNKKIKCIEFETAKKVAIIFIDEILEEVREYCDYNFHTQRLKYYNDIKKEIELL